jgi:Flp pilus assembly protein TadD
VVGEEKLAHAYYLAGSFQEAAALYRLLREKNPDDEHLLQMLVVSERNAGNVEEARALLDEFQRKGTESSEWGRWMVEMIDLGKSPAGEGT